MLKTTAPDQNQRSVNVKDLYYYLHAISIYNFLSLLYIRKREHKSYPSTNLWAPGYFFAFYTTSGPVPGAKHSNTWSNQIILYTEKSHIFSNLVILSSGDLFAPVPLKITVTAPLKITVTHADKCFLSQMYWDRKKDWELLIWYKMNFTD